MEGPSPRWRWRRPARGASCVAGTRRPARRNMAEGEEIEVPSKISGLFRFFVKFCWTTLTMAKSLMLPSSRLHSGSSWLSTHSSNPFVFHLLKDHVIGGSRRETPVGQIQQRVGHENSSGKRENKHWGTDAWGIQTGPFAAH